MAKLYWYQFLYSKRCYNLKSLYCCGTQQCVKVTMEELMLDPPCSTNMATSCAQPTTTCPKSHRSGRLGALRWPQQRGRCISTWLPIPTCRPAHSSQGQLDVFYGSCGSSPGLFFLNTPQPALETQQQQGAAVVVYTRYLPSASAALTQLMDFMD